MSENTAKIPVVIDTDPGVDDFVSILWVLAHREFDVKALTITNGNVGVDACVTNALRALEIAGRNDIPMYRGSYRPIVKDAIDASWYHGEDGLGDLGLPLPTGNPAEGYAPLELARIARESPEPITLLCLAPLTNIAMAMLCDADFSAHVDKIIFMGGAGFLSGNETPRASYNVQWDADAARIVYRSGIEIVQIGLDVCDFVTQDFNQLEEIVASRNTIADLYKRLLYGRKDRPFDTGLLGVETSDFPMPLKRTGIGLNDLTATGYLLYPELFKTMKVFIDVETQGLCEGETVVDVMGLSGERANAQFAYEVDGATLVSTWKQEMIRSY